ncbi:MULTISPECIES: hypothetical protein [unclassified Streptomyces]|uniref:hypothetical protein n=1 Tax=unclassified Streptomyces TaxID=2593676 RepID=UPI002238DEBB|nr:hypothetical protein [Streptomyces sp. SHP 1-2]MCW5253890.1 hypothetical protein [Streptomyces sp. SHP 1-2]
MPTLLAASGVVSPAARPFDDSPEDLAHHRALAASFGAEVEERLLRDGPNVGHRDLVDRLARADGVRGSDPDLVVVAHALPDLTPFTAIAPHLDHLLGGRSVNFGIHQQGLAAPFTALRAIDAFQRAGRAGRAVLAVLEQTTLPTRFPLVHDNGLVDSGVVLVLGTGDGPRLAGVETVPATGDPVRRLAELTAADPDGTLLVTGPWTDHEALRPVTATTTPYRVNRGTYATGLWLALARQWRLWCRHHRTVVLCDTDPRSGDTHIAVLATRSAPPAGGPR